MKIVVRNFVAVFITLYGVNNIGKSTQAKLLVERLRAEGKRVEYLKYPIYDSETGRELNNILRNGGRIPSTKNFGEHFKDLKNDEKMEEFRHFSEEELQTLFMQNRLEFEPTLKCYLDEGAIVIAEDYTGTGIGWGMAKGLTREFLERLNKNLIHEDFAILLSGKRDDRAREAHHIHEQNIELMNKVAGIFEELGQLYGWERIEIQPKIEETAEMIYRAVLKKLA